MSDLVFDAIKSEFGRRQSVLNAGRRAFMGLTDDAKSGVQVIWTRQSMEDVSSFGDAPRTELQKWECRVNSAKPDADRCADTMRVIADAFRNTSFHSSDFKRIGMHLTDRAGPALADDKMQGVLTFGLMVDWRH